MNLIHNIHKSLNVSLNLSMIYLFECKKNKFLTQKHTDFSRVCNLKALKQIIHSFQTYVHGHYNDIWDTCIF